MTSPLRVSLRKIADELDVIDQETSVYLDRRTGETVSYNPNWDFDEELAQLAEELDSSEHFVPLPDAFDIHEWSIMQRFARSAAPQDLRDDLLRALHGRGAFRSFKDAVHRRELADDCHRFRDDAFVVIARAWLEAEGIAYVDDVGTGDASGTEATEA